MPAKQPGITITIQPDEAPAVLKALRNHSTYLRSYTHDSGDATVLDRIADEIEEQE